MKIKIFSGFLALVMGLVSCKSTNPSTEAKTTDGKEYYEWRYYSVNEGKEQVLDSYLEKVLLPAYERQGAQTGAFKYALDSLSGKEKENYVGKETHRIVLLAYKDLDSYKKAKTEIWNDAKFKTDAQPFFDESAKNQVYSNFAAYVCEAFEGRPTMSMPESDERMFEIRTYWSPNEDANKRKISMFHNGEMKAFEQSGVNDLCYGEVISGPMMPALIYLTSYKDVATRIKVWDAFRANPIWNEIKGLPQYENTATNCYIELVEALPFSKI